MSISFVWSNSRTLGSFDRTGSGTNQCTVLDFIILAASLEIEMSNTSLAHLSINEPNVGEGSVSTVRKGYHEGQLVAVKQCRVASRPLYRDESNFTQYLNHLMKEVRVLALRRIKDHPNIIKLLSYGVEGQNNISPFVVLEYSNLGRLDTFLHDQRDISASDQIAICLDVANALEALHSLYICHGDVKTANAMVFEAKDHEDRGWIVKLADFSQTICGDKVNLTARVFPSPGTILLNAPEIRKEHAYHDKAFNIQHALLTDIFSYGLLVWEIMLGGRSYIDYIPCNKSATEQKEDFLNTLPEDALVDFATDFLDGNYDEEASIGLKFKAVLKGALRDDPMKRQSIRMSVQILSGRESLDPSSQSYPETNPVQSVTTFASSHNNISLFELFDQLPATTASQYLPENVEKAVLKELRHLAAGESGPQYISKAAMMLCDCHVLGFGGCQSMEIAIDWLLEAAIHGSYRAQSWLYRLWETFKTTQIPKQTFPHSDRLWDNEMQLSGLSEPSYFSRRIRLYGQEARHRAEQDLNNSDDRFLDLSNDIHWDAISDLTLDLEVFGQDEVDTLSALHWCAWMNFGKTIREVAHLINDINLQSSEGRTPLFYACLGGNIAMVRLLCNNGADASIPDAKGVTPLHLAIMFEENDVGQAVAILLQHGADLEASTKGSVGWDTHDLLLDPKPLEWAVQTRYFSLTKCFLEHDAEVCGLGSAINCHFSEIADLLLAHGGHIEPKQDIGTNFSHIRRPFAYWLAHGKERVKCTNSTLEVFEKYGHGMKEPHMSEPIEGSEMSMSVRNGHKLEVIRGRTATSVLISCILNARLLDDINSTKQMIIGGIDVKRKVGVNSFSLDALGMTIFKISRNPSWQPVFDLILSQYSREELNCPAFLGSTYLFRAVHSGPPLVTRLLLAHGADPNCTRKNSDSQNIAAIQSNLSTLQSCLQAERPIESFNLLLDYGADTAVPGSSPFSLHELPFTSFRKDTSTLDAILSKNPNQSQLLQILHTSFDVAMATNMELQDATYALTTFRYLLQHETVRALVNHPKDGLSLIHWAAYAMDYELVLLLLEAGAECDRLCHHHGVLISPLQLLLAISEVEWMLLKHDYIPLWGKKRCRSALRTASLLLKHYHLAQSRLFVGVTDLHLAAYMDDSESVQQLMRSAEADIHSHGVWPTTNCPVTPRELFLGSRRCESIFYIRVSQSRPEDRDFPDLHPGLHDDYERASKYLESQFHSTHNGDRYLSLKVDGKDTKFSIKEMVDNYHKTLKILYGITVNDQ